MKKITLLALLAIVPLTITVPQTAQARHHKITPVAAPTNQIDPETGDEIDAVTGDLIDPATGDLIDPVTGDLIDPVTGEVIEPVDQGPVAQPNGVIEPTPIDCGC